MFLERKTAQQTKQLQKCDYNEENHTLNGVPLWKLFVDKDCHDEGALAFDKSYKVGGRSEPGYNQAMTLAFNYVLQNIGKKLDAEEFLNIHYMCVKGLRTRQN